MDETQIKQIIERQPLHGTALLDPRCKILLLVCIGFVSYFLAGEVVSLALMLVYGLFITLGNGGKWAAKMIITYAEKVNGVWEQRLRIHYNCVGTIEIPSALPLPTPDVSVNTRKGVVVNYAPCDVAI